MAVSCKCRAKYECVWPECDMEAKDAEIASLRAERDLALRQRDRHIGILDKFEREAGIAARQDAEEKARLREVLTASEKGLKPFASAVFNDNGDMTVSPCHDGYEDFIAAYFALRKVRAALACRPQEKPHGA